MKITPELDSLREICNIKQELQKSKGKIKNKKGVKIMQKKKKKKKEKNQIHKLDNAIFI